MAVRSHCARPAVKRPRLTRLRGSTRHATSAQASTGDTCKLPPEPSGVRIACQSSKGRVQDGPSRDCDQRLKQAARGSPLPGRIDKARSLWTSRPGRQPRLDAPAVPCNATLPTVLLTASGRPRHRRPPADHATGEPPLLLFTCSNNCHFNEASALASSGAQVHACSSRSSAVSLREPRHNRSGHGVADSLGVGLSSQPT